MYNIKDLLKDRKITLYDYRCYLLFEQNEIGKKFLEDIIEMTFLESPPSLNNETSFAWKDGRHSVWREIIMGINAVKTVLNNSEEVNGSERE